MAGNKTVTVKLVRIPIGRRPSHHACVRGLGLRKLQGSATLEDTPAVRGMINKVIDLLEVTESV